MAVIDTLKLARALRDKGGFSQDAAEATAEALDNAFGDAAGTKRDLADLGTSLRAETAALGTALREEIGTLKSDIRLLKWQVGLNSALSIAILIKLFVH